MANLYVLTLASNSGSYALFFYKKAKCMRLHKKINGLAREIF